MIRIGVDVGGTFTDVVALDEQSGRTSWLKTLTDEANPGDGVMEAVAASGVPAEEVSRVRLGTTLGVNAVLTRTGALTGLITTRGFRDVLEIRRTHRMRLFDLEERPPDPLVPRDLRLEVTERIDADGAVVTALDEAGVRAAWQRLRAAGVRALAIVFLFSFENPEHELRAREIVLEEGGAEVVFISSEVLPVHREYERTSTTVMAAYVGPALQHHVTDLSERLRHDGLPPGRLSVMTSSGGVHEAAALARNPIPSLLSGPASGVAGARRLAWEAGLKNVLTLDMGGTSCDVSGIVEGVPDERLDVDIEGLAVAYPTFDIKTIGAGGGSIAWIDSGGALRVGPRSAGSDPGPACYGRGGAEPTVTDANLVLGRYDPEIPLGARIQLDPERARAAIAEYVAAPLGLSVERAAAGIVRIVNALMAGAVGTISLERGRDVRDFTLVAFGGAGPVHAGAVAAELGIGGILVPACPGCTSALGGVMADSRHDQLCTIARRVWEVSDDVLGAVAEGLIEEARQALAEEGFGEQELEFELWLGMRYEGQVHELSIRRPLRGESATTDGSLPAGWVARREPLLEGAAVEFGALHERLYGHSFADVTVEVVNVRVTGYGRVRSPQLRWQWSNGEQPRPASRRRVYFEETEEFVQAEVLRREQIAAGDAVRGPAVIHQLDATVLVPPGLTASAHPSGSLLLRADPSSAHARWSRAILGASR
jgi:N-methylhydantoinase A